MDYYLIKYLHLLGVLGVVATVAMESVLVKDKVSNHTMKQLSKIDAVYGLSSILVLLGGLGLWFWVGKPSEFYTSNLLLHIKIGLFVIVGLLSIYPTVFFIKNRKSDLDEIIIPKLILRLIYIELLILILLPFLAVFVAEGKTSIW